MCVLSVEQSGSEDVRDLSLHILQEPGPLQGLPKALLGRITVDLVFLD